MRMSKCLILQESLVTELGCPSDRRQGKSNETTTNSSETLRQISLKVTPISAGSGSERRRHDSRFKAR